MATLFIRSQSLNHNFHLDFLTAKADRVRTRTNIEQLLLLAPISQFMCNLLICGCSLPAVAGMFVGQTGRMINITIAPGQNAVPGHRKQMGFVPKTY